MTILIGNINADKSKLALYPHTFDDGMGQYRLLEPIKLWETPMTNYAEQNLPKIISDYLSAVEYNPNNDGDIYAVCFGISGPVENKLNTDNTKKASILRSNFTTEFTIADLRNCLPPRYKDIPIILLNDMEAIGYAVLNEDQNKLESINFIENIDEDSPKAVMLVSDGLGQIAFSKEQSRQISFSSEGGHSLFAPRNHEEIDLLKHLMDSRSPLSSEYILSNRGLVRIYNFLVIRDNGQNYTEPEELRQLRDSLNNLGGSVDPQPIIKAAFDHEQVNSFCLRAVEMFISIWGAKAGDIALTYNAKAGVYIGGIPIPIVEQKKQNVFLESFKDKEGKFSNFNANIPVYIYKTDRIVLQGAARYLTIGHHITSGIIIVRRMIDQGE